MGKHRNTQRQQALGVPAAVPIQSGKAFVGDSFNNFMAAVGINQPASNQSAAGRYGQDFISRQRATLDAVYRTSWICGVAVDAVAEDCTKRGIEVISSADPMQVDGLHSAWRDMHLWDQICDVIKWGRLYGGAVGVLLLEGQNVSTPLRWETVGAGAFKGIYPLDRWTAQPVQDWPVREYGPDLGKPMYYDVISDTNHVLGGQRIHYSRVVRVDGVDLPYYQRFSENLWGQSILERLWDRLLAFDSTTQGAAQLVYKAHLRTVSIDGLREIIAAGGPARAGLTAQIDFMRLMQSNEGITLMDSKDKFEAHSYTFSGLDTILLQFGQQLSGALQIPLVRLFGQSPAGLNSTGDADMRNYYDGIMQQQERRLRSPLSNLLHITWRSLYGTDLPPGTNFNFHPLWVMSDEQKAGIASTITAAVTQAQTSGIVRRETALRELKNSAHATGLWSNITDEEIQEAEDEPPPGAEGLEDPDGGDDDDEDNQDQPDEDEGTKDRAPRTEWRRYAKRFLGFRDDDWKESDHPRADSGEFSTVGQSGKIRVHSSIAHHFKNTNEDLTDKPQQALDWVRKGPGRFVPGAISHPAVPGGIGLLYGEPGDSTRNWRGGFGVSHIDAKREGYLDEAIRKIPTLPLVDTIKGEKTGRVLGKVLSDGQRRAVVSLDLRGHDVPAWLLTSYEDTGLRNQ